jgi:hypothetical protein
MKFTVTAGEGLPIGSQLDLTAAEVVANIKPGQIPKRQKRLFADSAK